MVFIPREKESCYKFQAPLMLICSQIRPSPFDPPSIAC
nr:MAG TPA: hypothetical protein [Caudoviricetes sp.]